MAEAGFEIVIASSGEQAMELLDSSEGKFRALVTDINLGRDKLSGCEVARHAREIDPAFPVVYMSGNSAEDWASKALCWRSRSRLRSSSPLFPSFSTWHADKLTAVP